MGNQNGWYSYNVRFLNFELTMKPFNLEEYYKNPSRKVVTRYGKSVKIHCTNFHLFNQDIIAEIEGEDASFSFNRYGQLYGSLEECPEDLFFVTEKHHEGWVSIYVDSKNIMYTGACIHKSKDDAEKTGKERPGYITTIKIEWEE